MASRLEDYALIGDLRTAALIGRDGSLDWLCLPRFDAPACFAALLGQSEHGRWLLAPAESVRATARRYRGNGLIAETTYTTAGGTVRATEFMARGTAGPTVVRIVDGLAGSVPMTSELAARFGMGVLPPWTRAIHGGCTMTVLGDALALRSDVPLTIVVNDVHARFVLREGDRVAFVLSWYPAYEEPSTAADPAALLAATDRFWAEWSAQLDYAGAHADIVLRSATILKALFFEPHGACVAAITTSLPEALGGRKNWDYRYSWVRDSTFTIEALLHVGLVDEARRWRDWVLRALAGDPSKLQIMYGVNGQRILEEYVVHDLPGYEGSRPVRAGNAAYEQFQLGVYGQAMGAMYEAHSRGVELDASGWAMLRRLLAHVERVWEKPDAGIWESRGEPKHFVLSKAESWRAFDRAARMVREFGYQGDAERWTTIADRIRDQVCARGFNERLGAFAEAYDSEDLDASVLLLPIIGFLPADDPRVARTVRALEDRLMQDGFIYRTSNDPETAGSQSGPTEGAFIACNFWLIENYVMLGRFDDAHALFDRICAVAGDLGLLSEEYDPHRRRLVGNIPQTFSHATLINAATELRRAEAERRSSPKAVSGSRS